MSPKAATCAWTLRDGSPCKAIALVDGLCPAHYDQRRALETEEAERAARGEPPMSERQRDRFLKAFGRARKAARRQVAWGPRSSAG